MLHFCLSFGHTFRHRELFLFLLILAPKFIGVGSRIWYHSRVICNHPDGWHCTLLLRWPNGHVTLQANMWSGIPPVTGSSESVCQADERVVRQCWTPLRHLWETDLQERLSVQSPVSKDGNRGHSSVNGRLFQFQNGLFCCCPLQTASPSLTGPFTAILTPSWVPFAHLIKEPPPPLH